LRSLRFVAANHFAWFPPSSDFGATGVWFAVSHFELSRPEFFVSLWRNAVE
jgi:hypothetical protein